MPALGTLTVTTYRGQPDRIDYQLPGHTVSTTNLVSLQRRLPVKKGADLGSMQPNMRFEKSFPVGDTVKPVVFNFSGVIPVGVDPTALTTYLNDVVRVAVAAAPATALMTAGDINLSD